MHNSCTLLLLLLPTFNSANCLWRALCSAPLGPSVLCSALFTQRWLQLAAHCDDYLFTYRLLAAFGFGFAFCLLALGLCVQIFRSRLCLPIALCGPPRALASCQEVEQQINGKALEGKAICEMNAK